MQTCWAQQTFKNKNLTISNFFNSNIYPILHPYHHDYTINLKIVFYGNQNYATNAVDRVYLVLNPEASLRNKKGTVYSTFTHSK